MTIIGNDFFQNKVCKDSKIVLFFFSLIFYSKQCQTDNSSFLEKAFEYFLEHESFFKLRMKVALSIFEIDRLTE